MKTKIDYHLHSMGSDGIFSPTELVTKAIKAGLKSICFADHYPLPSKIKDWGPKFGYVKEVNRVREKFKAKIQIAFGAEFDWLSKFKKWTADEIKRADYDYIIGSIHFLPKNGEYISVAYGDDFRLAVRAFGGILPLVHEYYRQMRLMAKSGLFDGIGHFDLIKCYNKDSEFFLENKSWYQEDVFGALEEIARSRMCMEINTSGWRVPVGIQYPSKWILEEARKKNIPVTIGSDGHENVGWQVDKAAELAREVGYNSVLVFNKRKRVEVPLN